MFRKHCIISIGTVMMAVAGLLVVFLILRDAAPAAHARADSNAPVLSAQYVQPFSVLPVEKAHQHLAEVMDKYHLTLDVYTDVGAGGNHFVHRAKMGTQVFIDDTDTQVVHSGATAIRNVFTGALDDWGGWSFQNGVLLTGTVAPSDNWGTYPNAGINLNGAAALTFWARGAVGGERVEFYAFGVNGGPYGDSAAKRTTCGSSATCFVTLSNTWQIYTIPLTGLDLSYIIGGFGWVTNAPRNNSQSITFYLDDIRYDKPHTAEPRFLVSFETITTALPFDEQFRNVGYTYDNALALIAFVARADWDRAQLLADAFVYAQRHDRFYTDGRLRNAYQSGDLVVPPGWFPSGSVRPPGWWSAPQNKWIEDPEQVGSTTGNLAWAMIALLNYYEERGGSQYLTTTVNLGNWIVSHTHDTRGAGGFTGGYIGHEPNPEKQLWKSTEHNLDLYVAFSRLYHITGDSAWLTQAQHARDFVEAMNLDGRCYRTGTLTDGVTVDTSVIPLDTQSWSALAFGSTPLTREAIATAEISHTATYSGFAGFDFNTDQDMPWPEGTAQMVSAYWMLGHRNQAAYYLDELHEMQSAASRANGKGLVAAPADGLTTGFGWSYYNRLHVAATAWFIIAEQALNPYWQTYYRAMLYLPLVRH
jgi:hypothetical protein